MEPNITEIRLRYEQIDEDLLTRIATQEARDLRPEAIQVLKEVIRTRSLSEKLISSIDAQISEINDSTINEYCSVIRTLPCLCCNSEQKQLNASLVCSVTSFLVLTFEKNELRIACPTCLDDMNNSASIKTLFLGWWGIPWGLIKSPRALFRNYKSKKQNHAEQPNDLLKLYVIGTIGQIEFVRESRPELIDFVRKTAYNTAKKSITP